MGYHATGTVIVKFATPERADAARQALLTAGCGTGYASMNPQTFQDVMANVWDAEPEEIDDDGQIRYCGYVSDKWVTDCQTFGAVVAPFASYLFGEFTGEDDAQWGWIKDTDGTLNEFSYVPVPDFEHKGMLQDNGTLNEIAVAIAAGDNDAVLRLAKVGVMRRMDTAGLAVLANDPDEQVRKAVSDFIVENA